MQCPGVRRCARDALAQMPESLVADFKRFLPSGIGLGVANPECEYPLGKGECTKGMIQRRRAEFSAGRFAARQALGISSDLPMGADRAPIWPTGWTGSITHCQGVCLAISAKTSLFQGLGVDAEPVGELPRDLWSTVLRPDEHAADGLEALELFVAKEAAFKAQFAISGQLFDFQTLSIQREGNVFFAHFRRAVEPFAFGFRLEGRFVMGRTHLGAFVAIAKEKIST